MLKKLFSLLILFGLCAPLMAAEWPQVLDALESEDYAARYKARMDVQSMMSEATAPTSDPAPRATLEAQLLERLQASNHLDARLWMLRMLELFGTEASVDALEGLLSDDDAHLRDAARQALMANPSDAAGQALRDALIQSPENLTSAYIAALVYRNDQDAIRPIAEVLKSENPRLVEQAAAALGALNGRRSQKALAKARKSATEETMPFIERALLKTGVKASWAKELTVHGSTSAIREDAFRQLAHMDAKEAKNLLTTLLPDLVGTERTVMLHAAMTAPGTVLKEALAASLPAAEPSDQQVILSAIAEQDLVAYEENLLTLLPMVEGPVRESVVRALGVIGGENSYQILYDAYLESPDEIEAAALTRLKVPAVDAQLFVTAADDTDLQKQLAAVMLLGLRNPEGTQNLFHQLAGPDQPEDLRKAVFKALETVGNVESAKHLASAIAADDPLKRSAQQSLKKLSANLRVPDVLWREAVEPVLKAGTNQTAEDFLVILDGVAGPGSLNYLDGLISDPASPLRPAAIQSLSRWPNVDAERVWLKMLASDGLSDNDRLAVQKGLARILSRDEIEATPEQKIDLAAKVIPLGSNRAFKQAVLSACKKPDRRSKKHAEKAFTPLLDDVDVGYEVYAFLGKTPPSPVADPEFTLLFDGTTLKGWTVKNGTATYKVRNGAIVGTSVEGSPNTFLCTDRDYAHFELTFDVRCEAINSGVQIRSKDTGSKNEHEGRVNGPQVEIEHGPGQAGFVYGEGMGTGWRSPEPTSKDPAVNQHAHFKNDQWNQYRIVAEGPRIQTWVNGVPVADLTDEESYASHPKGFIGLQVHSHKVPGVEIEWRNIQIKELPEPEVAPEVVVDEWTALLDQDLSGWEVWTGVPHESVQNLPEGTVGSKDVKKGTPIGLGDPMKLYTVSPDADGMPVLRISGEVYGGITTRESFTDYHLTMQFKWGEKKWEPRLNEKRDSGLLYHCYGEHGAFWNVWKRCLELQIQEGDFGDLHCIGDTASSVATTDEHWDPAGTKTAKRAKRSIDKESPHGEWTRIDLYVLGDSAVHVVNGTVVLALTAAKTHDGQRLDAGQLQIQSEAAECFAKDIRIRPITEFPADIKTAAGL